ncbi:MAG: aspartate kinase [bacterium]|nr:aspartate kinase [bacterium]
MALVVQKFGGTSVADAERIREVADHVRRSKERGDEVVLVISAMGKETDELLTLAAAVSKTRPGREMDMLITAGERKACALVCMALHDMGIAADSFTGKQAGFATDNNHGNAKIIDVYPTRVQTALKANRVAVVAGSQGANTAEDDTFLGRGGSDTTAVALALALNADACELYTDVSGVFTTDPRVCPDARKLTSITFEELLEMTAVGCPKPAMRSVEVAQNYGVKLHIRSAFTWEQGTWVVKGDSSMEQPIIRSVTPDTTEAKITVSKVADRPGVAAALFQELAAAGVNVDMIVQNASADGITDISFTVPEEDLTLASEITHKVANNIGAKNVAADPQIARISLVGAGMKSHPGVAAKMFETLSKNNINIEMISTSPIRISCIIRQHEATTATQALHEAFGLSA